MTDELLVNYLACAGLYLMMDSFADFQDWDYEYLQAPSLGVRFSQRISADKLLEHLICIYGPKNVKKQLDGNCKLWGIITEGEEHLGKGYYFRYFSWDCVYFPLTRTLEIT